MFIGYATIDWEEAKINGIGALINDTKQKRFFLKILEIKKLKTIFKCEIWNGFTYEKICDLFYAFKRKRVYYGLGFKNTTEASNFFINFVKISQNSTLNESQQDMNLRQRKKYQEKKEKQQKLIVELQRINENSKKVKIPENWAEVLKLANISCEAVIDTQKTVKMLRQSYKVKKIKLLKNIK